MDRSAATALQYFTPALSIGPWNQWLRRGFDLFLVAKEVSTSTSSAAAVATSTAMSFTSFFNPFKSSSTGSGSSASSTTDLGGSDDTTITSATMNPEINAVHVRDTLYIQSLVCYLYAAELGQEVAESNAMYILRTKLLSSNALVSETNEYSSLSALQHSLVFHYLRNAEIHQQAEAWIQLGHLFFPRAKSTSASSASTTLEDDAQMQQVTTGAGVRVSWVKPSYEQARYCYQRAVILSEHPMALVYLGVMHHFGLGMEEGPSTERASRYYSWALTSSKFKHHANILTSQMQWMISSLQTALSWSQSSTLFGQTLHGGLEYVLTMLWQ